MTIHHYESNYHWTAETNFDKMNEGDVVIAPDPQETLGEGTFCVSEIADEMAMDRVVRRGLFWKVEEAQRYAKALNAINQGDLSELPDDVGVESP